MIEAIAAEATARGAMVQMETADEVLAVHVLSEVVIMILDRVGVVHEGVLAVVEADEVTPTK